jgi:NADPH-dependent curcumin reductase CurA
VLTAGHMSLCCGQYGAQMSKVLRPINESNGMFICSSSFLWPLKEYNDANAGDATDHLPATMRVILSKSITLRGYINYEFTNDFYDDSIRDVTKGLRDGSIRYREDIADGFKMPRGFLALLVGRNFGKVIVNLVEEN